MSSQIRSLTSQNPTAENSASSPAQQRREVQNDVESIDDLNRETTSALRISPTSTLAREGFTYEKYRAGAPPLQPLLLESIEPARDDPIAYRIRNWMFFIQNELAGTHVQVVKGMDIEEPMIEIVPMIRVVHRVPEGETACAQNLTVLVCAFWNEEEDGDVGMRWLHAIEHVRNLLLENPRILDVKIEIIAPERWQHQTDHPVVPLWGDTIRYAVHALITRHHRLKEKWYAVGLERIQWPGYVSYDGMDYRDCVVEILIRECVDPVSLQEARAQVKDVLWRFNGLEDVDVVFVREGDQENGI
ncbi:hypothetical protein ACLMJK_006318 [Lecanora helva]